MKRWGGQIWEGRTLPAKGPDIIYLVLVKLKQGYWQAGCSHSADMLLHVISVEGVTSDGKVRF